MADVWDNASSRPKKNGTKSNEGRVKSINFFLEEADHFNLKIHATTNRSTLQAIVCEALNLYLQEKNLPLVKAIKAYRP